MKRFIIIILLILPGLSFSQVKVDGVDINSLEGIKYIEIVGFERLLSTKVTVTIDYGQKMKFGSDQRIEKEDGKPIIFNSVIEALNFLNKNGWEFVNNYAVTISNQNVYHYLLKRREQVNITGN